MAGLCARDVETCDLWACFTLSGPVPYLRYRGAGRPQGPAVRSRRSYSLVDGGSVDSR